jgi:hypothetical protein
LPFQSATVCELRDGRAEHADDIVAGVPLAKKVTVEFLRGGDPEAGDSLGS